MSQISDPIPLSSRFATIKKQLIEGRHEAIVSSWHRLLAELEVEVNWIRSAGSDITPSISFNDLRDDINVKGFATSLKKRGVGVVRSVVSDDVVQDWMTETQQYLSHNSFGDIASRCQTHDIFWSPVQIRTRAHQNVLATQRILMNFWHTSEADPLTPNFPAMYADRLNMAQKTTTNGQSESMAYMSGDSVDKWEPDAKALAYRNIWEGRWEDYDPWASQSQLRTSPNMYNSKETSSVVQLWQGLFCLDSASPGVGPLRICPMLHLSTAYILLRPFFRPKDPCPEKPGYLLPSNWILEIPSSIIPGAAPGQRQQTSDVMHPHLCLSETLVSVPHLGTGDYLVFHPDSMFAPQPSQTTTMSLPICPLTRTNGLYLLDQRRSFLLGQQPPDFQQNNRDDDSQWVGRLGVQEVSDTGGENALRAMGLAPWDEDDVEGAMEAEILEDANNVLFPDRYEFG